MSTAELNAREPGASTEQPQAKPGTPSWYKGTKIITAGIVKIGAMSTGPKGPRPEKLDHFRYCSSSVNRDGYYPDHPDFKAENEANLAAIPVQLFTDDEDLNVEFGWQLMKGGATVCRGLGNGDMNPERRPSMDPTKAFERTVAECGETCPFAKTGACKRVSVARLIVPGRNSKGLLHTPLNSVWQFRSHGDNTAQLLRNAMRDFKALSGGILAGIPLLLTMQRETRRGVSAFYSVGLTFDGLPGDLEECVMREITRRDRFKAFQASREVKPATMEDLLRAQGRTIGFEPAADTFAINAEFSPTTLNHATPPVAGAEAPAATNALGEAGQGGEAPVAAPAPAPEVAPPAPQPTAASWTLPVRLDQEPDLTGPQSSFINSLAAKIGCTERVAPLKVGMGKEQAKALITFLKDRPEEAKLAFA